MSMELKWETLWSTYLSMYVTSFKLLKKPISMWLLLVML